jgi:flagellar protein FlgJ
MRLPSASLPLNAPAETSAGTSHARIEKAARELETQFAQMLIKSMRSASMGDSLLGEDTTYRDMYDQQLARELTKGRGLGLAPMIMRQLERTTGAAQSPAAPVAAPTLAPATNGGLSLTPSTSGISMPAIAPMPLPAPTAAPACDPDAPLDCSSPEAFVRSVWPHAQKTAAELGVPAKALVAQAALETGWGRRLAQTPGATSNNLFGIKAGGGWNGQRMRASTHEYTNGVRETTRADFRAYGSAAESFEDYARLLGNARYAAARGTGEDTHRFAAALQQAGYATDPAYAAKVTAIANGDTLNRALAGLN